MSIHENDNVADILDAGLNPEERARLTQWEDGLASDFWNSLVVPFILSQKEACESVVLDTKDVDTWRETKGKLAFIRSMLALDDYVTTQYATFALDRLSEMEASFDEPDDLDSY